MARQAGGVKKILDYPVSPSQSPASESPEIFRGA